MREHWVHVEHDFDAPVEKVFAYLAEHENLAAVFGAKVKRLNDGDTDRNGVGSRRELRIGPLPPFEETVVRYEPNELIEYKITKGSPLKGHVGIQKFTATPSGGTHLDYRIRVASAIPGVATLTHAGLSRNIPRGLAKAQI
jgi:uncharacterized protein YndB with AHSA1/START domain